MRTGSSSSFRQSERLEYLEYLGDLKESLDKGGDVCYNLEDRYVKRKK